MYKFVALALAVLLTPSVCPAQRQNPPSAAELAAITERGRMLAEYDQAAWHATDAVQPMAPAAGSITRYVAQKVGTKWIVAFGRFDEKRTSFLVVYEATQGATPTEFTPRKLDPPRADTGFYFAGAKALELATSDFKGEARPYNAAVLPAANGLFVYVMPAQTEDGIFPLGGDARYLVAPDGSKIVEKRQLHASILEFKTPSDATKVTQAFHTAVLDDIPEDTDVFHVLARTPSIPEWVASKKFVYQIRSDGSIVYLMTFEAFQKLNKK